MKLLIVEKGIPIDYNQNEHTIETVFGLNDTNQIIQNFTFQCPIYYDPMIFNQALINTRNTIDVSHGYLFYSFRYQISYQHFLTQTLPLLDSYLKSYSNYTLLVPKHHYTLFVKDILSLLNIHNILLLEDHTIYSVSQFATRNWQAWSSIHLGPEQYNIYNLLREKLNILPNTVFSRKIYLKKDGIANPTYGNSETGITRKILNEEDLIKQLQKEGFEIIHVGDKLLHEKMELLKDAHIIITQLGANCMNLVFTNAPKHLLFLSNESIFGKHYYSSLSQIFNKTKIHVHTLVYPNDPVHFDSTNYNNAAFTVSIEDVLKYIVRI